MFWNLIGFITLMLMLISRWLQPLEVDLVTLQENTFRPISLVLLYHIAINLCLSPSAWLLHFISPDTTRKGTEISVSVRLFVRPNLVDATPQRLLNGFCSSFVGLLVNLWSWFYSTAILIGRILREVWDCFHMVYYKDSLWTQILGDCWTDFVPTV